jgi:hypothetical protein
VLYQHGHQQNSCPLYLAGIQLTDCGCVMRYSWLCLTPAWTSTPGRGQVRQHLELTAPEALAVNSTLCRLPANSGRTWKSSFLLSAVACVSTQPVTTNNVGRCVPGRLVPVVCALSAVRGIHLASDMGSNRCIIQPKPCDPTRLVTIRKMDELYMQALQGVKPIPGSNSACGKKWCRSILCQSPPEVRMHRGW